MPAVIGAVAGAAAAEIVGSFVVGSVMMGATAAVVTKAVVGGVVGGIVAGSVTRALTPTPSGSSGAALVQPATSFEQLSRGALINSGSSVEPIPVLYGSRRIAPSPASPWMAYGDTNEKLARVFTCCEGEISGIGSVYLDNVESTDARYAGLVTLEKYVGTDAQTASAALIAAFPGVITANFRQRGTAYLVVILTWDEDAWSGAPNVTCDVTGKLVLDVRTSTTAYSNNPALCIYDYLTNTRYGRGYASSRLDTASFIAAANYCDELINYPVAGSPSYGQQKRYTCDGLVNVDALLLDNLNDLLTSCRGWLIRAGSKIKLVLDKPETVSSTFEFNEDNIVGGWQIRKPGKQDKTNRVRARFFNPDRDWQPDVAAWPPRASDASFVAFLAEDNDKLLDREIALPFTANFYRSQQIAQIECKQSREGLTARFRATVAGLRCEVGDVVPITHSSTGWDEKPFRVLNLRLLSNDEVEVVAREYQASVYTLDDLDVVDTIPDTNLPNPFESLDITLGTPVSGTAELYVAGDGTVFPRIRLPFTAGTNPFVKYFEVQFARSAGSPQDWQDAPDVVAPASQAYFHPVETGAAYDGRIRAVTTLGNAGAWAYFRGHTVVGKTALPSNVTGFSAVQKNDVVVFDTDRVADEDLDSIEVRFVEVGGTWDNASPLSNILRGETSTDGSVPPGTWDMLAKAKDTSGNYSETEARVTLEVTADGFTSIEAEEQAPDWLGAKTNMVKHWTGVLTPDSQSLASALDWEVFDEFVPNAYTDCYYEAPVIDKGIDATARIWADVVSVLGPGETSGVANPKLQVDTRLAAGAFDGFDNWTIGTAEFRYLLARIYIDTTLGKPVVSAFEVNIDGQARTEEFRSQSIGASGTTITWSTPFHNTPVVQITPVGTTALIPSAESPSTTSVIAHLYNTAGAGAAGTANVTGTGV